MRRLTAKMVRSGLVTAWRLAGWPTSRSPSSEKATIDGVVRMPSAFSMTLGFLPSITATQELVVPRSMPITLAMVLPLFSGRSAGPFRRPRDDPRWTAETPRPTPAIHVKRRPLRRLGSYRRAHLGRKTFVHGIASVVVTKGKVRHG